MRRCKTSKLVCIASAVFVVLASLVLASCGLNGSGNITINLPPIESSARAIAADKIDGLKDVTKSYRVAVEANGQRTEKTGKGGNYMFSVPVGAVATITVECLNIDSEVIVRAQKTIKVYAGVNNVDIKLSQDGEEVMQMVSATVNGNTTLKTLADAFDAINNAQDGAICTISVLAGQTVQMSAGVTLNTNKTVTISGGGTLRRASTLTTGNLITVSAGTVKFENITLDGANVASNGSVVKVSGSGAVVELGNGAMVQNGNSSNKGGGVSVISSGTLILNGGTITKNTIAVTTGGGGGVEIYSGSTFTMKNGEIKDNKATALGGGGVYVGGENSTFSMEGGVISDNITTKYSSGNSANSGGGGVYIGDKATFTMIGGEIKNNRTDYYGGGVFVNNSGSGGIFTGTGGTLSGNKAHYDENQTNGGTSAIESDYYIKSGATFSNTSSTLGVQEQ